MSSDMTYDGCIVWSAAVGPGGSLGGIEWGTATDGRRIYVAIANRNMMPYTLVPSGRQITWGSWSALDVDTGTILWQTADRCGFGRSPRSVGRSRRALIMTTAGGRGFVMSYLRPWRSGG